MEERGRVGNNGAKAAMRVREYRSHSIVEERLVACLALVRGYWSCREVTLNEFRNNFGVVVALTRTCKRRWLGGSKRLNLLEQRAVVRTCLCFCFEPLVVFSKCTKPRAMKHAMHRHNAYQPC